MFDVVFFIDKSGYKIIGNLLVMWILIWNDLIDLGFI